MGKTAVFLSIREKATRLPKKVLLEVNGRSMTHILLERLKASKNADMIVVCTSTHPRDQVLVKIAEEMGVESFCGSEDDKLVRYRDAAEALGVEFMVIVDGDDIFVSTEYIDRAIVHYRSKGADFISQEGLPLGAASFGVRLEALKKVCIKKKDSDTEVWGHYFTRDPDFEDVMLGVTEEGWRRPDIRMTLDYPEDFEFFRTVLENNYEPGESLPFGKIMKYLNEHPEVVDINLSRQEEYMNNIKRKIDENIEKEME